MYFPFVGHHGGKDHQKCTLTNIERPNPTVYAFWRFEEHQLYNFLCGIKDHIVPYLSTTYWLFKVFSKTKISFHKLVPHPAVCHCHLLLPGCGHLNLFFLPSDKIAIKTNWSCYFILGIALCISALFRSFSRWQSFWCLSNAMNPLGIFKECKAILLNLNCTKSIQIIDMS